MKEHTFVMNVQLTSITKTEEGEEVRPKEDISRNIKAILMEVGIFDDVVIEDIKIFERDLEEGD